MTKFPVGYNYASRIYREQSKYELTLRLQNKTKKKNWKVVQEPSRLTHMNENCKWYFYSLTIYHTIPPFNDPEERAF